VSVSYQQDWTSSLRTVFHTGAARSAMGELQQLARQAQAADLSTLRDLIRRPYTDWTTHWII
jgi:hypothetical protein